MTFRTIKFRALPADNFGTTISARNLVGMLNNAENGVLTRKVTAHLNRYFREVKGLTTIPDKKHREYVGTLLLERLDSHEDDMGLELNMYYVLRNTKIAYVKDMLIAEKPRNYKNKRLLGG